MRLLITGASGQLGQKLFTESKCNTFGTYLHNDILSSNKNFFKMDIRNDKEVHDIVKHVNPDWIVHLASETDVDLCEDDKKHAWETNVNGVRNILNACKLQSSRILHVSSDNVFDGTKGDYKETDIPNPISFFAKTRLSGELLVGTYDKHIIIRTSILYGENGKFFDWVIASAKNGEVSAITDLHNTPTPTHELSSCILSMIKNDFRGTYHTVGPERISKYNFIKKFIQTFGYNEKIVKPILMEDVNFSAHRSKDSSLNTSKLNRSGIKFSSMDDSLKSLKSRISG